MMRWRVPACTGATWAARACQHVRALCLAPQPRPIVLAALSSAHSAVG